MFVFLVAGGSVFGSFFRRSVCSPACFGFGSR